MFSTSPRRRWLRLAALVGALLASLVAIPGTATAGAGAAQWRIVDLGLGHYSSAHAINDRGHIVGDHDGRAFLWRDGKVTYLDSSGDFAYATDINNHDEVVGFRLSGGSLTTGFVWRDGVMTDLVTPPGVPDSYPTAINDHGEVVGQMGGGAFRWRDGVMTALVGLPGAFHSEALDINNAGVIVGASGTMNTVAVSWRRGSIQPLTTAEAVTAALAVNDRGQVVLGNYSGPRAFLWHRGRSTVIEPPSGYGVLQPWGMNNRGQVVGDTIGVTNEAFVWQRGRITLLPRLVANGPGTAKDINNRGQIVGFAASDPATLKFHAVLWTR